MVRLPTPQQRVKPRAAEAGNPTMDLFLGEGDVLYFPRGWVHDARTFSADSMHVTIGIMVSERINKSD